MDYVVAGAYLRAENYSIQPDKLTNKELAAKAQNLTVKEFKAKVVKIAATEAEGNISAQNRF